LFKVKKLPFSEFGFRPLAVVKQEGNTTMNTAGMNDKLNEGRGSRRTTAGKQSNIGRNKTDPGQGRAEDQERRGVKHGCGGARDMDLPQAK
jgi:hypothetical protein